MPDSPLAPAAPLRAVAAAAPPAVRLCASHELAERGAARLFDVLLWGQPARAFAVRFEGRVVAYVNRCAHVPVEMDWQSGEFFDYERRWFVCSIHGATYDPTSGRCIAGPCAGARLIAVDVIERDGVVHWMASRDVRPVGAAPSTAPSGPP